MRLRTVFAIATFAALTIGLNGCKSDSSYMPPDPTKLINNTRDKLNPFRFTMTTDPASPNYNSPIMLKVHVIDAANQPADGVTVKADVSMSGMSQVQHITLSGSGSGDYQGQVSLDMAGSWDIDVSATRDGKSSEQKLSITVGG